MKVIKSMTKQNKSKVRPMQNVRDCLRLKNSFTIVFSVWYYLEKQVFFVDRKKIFFRYPGFPVFGFFPAQPVLWTFFGPTS